MLGLIIKIMTIIAALVTVYFYLRQNKDKPKALIITSATLIAVALIGSYDVLLYGGGKGALNSEILFQTPVVFLLLVFLQLLIGFWIVVIVVGLFKPDRISEMGAKFFGVEISHKFTEGVQTAKTSLEKLEDQLDIISNLNEATLEFVASPFEESILAAESQADKIREVVRDLLQKVYYHYPEIKILVLPLTEAGMSALGERLAGPIRLLWNEGVDLTQVECGTVGIGIHHGTEDLSTMIIIDGTAGNYEVSNAEICAASNFFISLSTIIEWAGRS